MSCIDLAVGTRKKKTDLQTSRAATGRTPLAPMVLPHCGQTFFSFSFEQHGSRGRARGSETKRHTGDTCRPALPPAATSPGRSDTVRACQSLRTRPCVAPNNFNTVRVRINRQLLFSSGHVGLVPRKFDGGWGLSCTWVDGRSGHAARDATILSGLLVLRRQMRPVTVCVAHLLPTCNQENWTWGLKRRSADLLLLSDSTRRSQLGMVSR